MTIRHNQIEGLDTLHSVTWQRYGQSGAWAGILIILFLALFISSALAKTGTAAKQRTFESPEEAVKTLTVAVKKNDDKELIAILGPGSHDLIASGDKVDDMAGRGKYLKAYEEKNRIDFSGDDKAILRIGNQDFLFPIPLIKKSGAWSFDTEAGKEELLCRRIGRNELNVIGVLHAYSDAQREYASRDRDGDGILEFAQRLISRSGKKDGLYWEVKEGEAESPFGPLIARAAQEGYTARTKMEPFHGYYFRIIKSQGPSAKGGAFDYVARGQMVLGFGLLAYPARYGSSGVMTFLVNQEGVIYQKDLGRKTAKAANITKYDPDKSWKKVEETVKK